jgi:hypothetical protein
MRVTKKQISDKAAIRALLEETMVGRVATNGGDGYPMIKPLNFVYTEGRIYFHSALEGEKMDDLRRDSRVCFEIDIPLRYVEAGENPCSASFRYRSVIARGRATLVDNDAERLSALRLLMKKYQPRGGYGDFLEEKLRITAVVRIDLEEISGKEDVRI